MGTSFRLGQRGPTPVSLDEQRLTVYLPAHLLDWAEDQAARAGEATVQVYCARLLGDAIEAEHGRGTIADAEARQGAFEGLNAIADDPEYLAEWVASATPADGRREITIVEAPDGPVRPTPASPSMTPAQPSTAALAVLRHAGVGTDDPGGFLATLRRGEPVADGAAGELLQALNALEVEYRQAAAIDRRVAYALHRLAFEGQILHTDAYPGVLPAETVNTLRIVQEAVDRVLSGEDIRYYPGGS